MTRSAIASLILLAASLAPAITTANSHNQELTPEAIRSAELFVQSRIGVGEPFRTIECVHSWSEKIVVDDVRKRPRKPPAVERVAQFCAFTYLPNGYDAIRVRVVVSQVNGGPWEGELPDCFHEPECCEVIIGRSEVIELAEEIGLTASRDGWSIQLGYRFEEGPGLYWTVHDAQVGNRRVSNRLLVVDSRSGEWWEETARPYIR